jgi:hypothetical protein
MPFERLPGGTSIPTNLFQRLCRPDAHARPQKIYR